jgi:hypothetical protein
VPKAEGRRERDGALDVGSDAIKGERRRDRGADVPLAVRQPQQEPVAARRLRRREVWDRLWIGAGKGPFADDKLPGRVDDLVVDAGDRRPLVDDVLPLDVKALRGPGGVRRGDGYVLRRGRGRRVVWDRSARSRSPQRW